jgi:hypothetical protein
MTYPLRTWLAVACLLSANSSTAAEPAGAGRAAWPTETLTNVEPKPRPANEPVLLKAAAEPAAVDGKSYDVVVVGATAGGVACAIRAAREGSTVLLVQHTGHCGGMIINGLMQWDALYGGHRSPLFTELLGNIEGYYAAKFGADSDDFKTVHYSHQKYPIGWTEPHVAEREFNRLMAREERLTLLLNHYPSAVERDGAIVRSATLCAMHGTRTVVVRGTVFVDATYEGDLFALAKVPYRVGREGRDEYNEPFAGKVFTNIAKGPAPTAAVEGRLNIRPYSSKQGTIDPTSPFTADRCVQAYNTRFCVTSDPANRIAIPKPEGYRREDYVDYERKYIAASGGPNRKSHVNSPILPGENHDYPEGDWPTRDRITKRHLDFGLGLMWFLQNDESVSAEDRKKFGVWGLPKDEFADNGHVPYEMYVREARRLVGRHVFTSYDNSLANGYGRTPVHPDSIAITDWYMDSHSCTTDHRPDYKYDGKLILTEESRPAQIPYRALLPQGVDNLLVPVCLSTTHIAWGAVRLEPVWMQTGEAAGFAAALAVRDRTTPAALDPERLLRTLIERRSFVSFFNDVNPRDGDPVVLAAEYFATKGFFGGYDATLDAPLSEVLGLLWADGLKQLNAGRLDARGFAQRVTVAEASASAPMSVDEWMILLPDSKDHRPQKLGPNGLRRGDALVMLWERLRPVGR